MPTRRTDKDDLNRSEMLSLRIQPSIKRRLENRAKRDNRSLSWYGQIYIVDGLDRDDRRDRHNGRPRRSKPTI